jgi:alpha-N-arabinofuranosidase
VDAVATHDAETGEVSVFVVNRGQDQPVSLSVPLGSFGKAFAVAESWTLADPDLSAANTEDEPDRVVPVETPGVAVTDGELRLELPPVSWSAIRLVAR